LLSFHVPPAPDSFPLSLHDALPIYFTAVSPTLMTEFRNGELDVTGTFMDQDLHEQDTAFTLEDGEFTATYAKDSPHFEDFELSIDRKSTRLNSSHVSISYAVFCLKK